VKIRTTKSDIRFCRRVRQKSRDARQMVIGLYTEEERRHILRRAKEQQESSKKQRSEETTMRDEAE
jgi:hypothetical protein